MNQNTFYGGKEGYDYVCFDKEMKVVASGKEEDMLKLHDKYGYAVGRLEAVRFIRSK